MSKGKGKAAAAAKGGAPKIKRPLSAYMLYAQTKRDKVVAENPNASFGEITKILAGKWKDISDERRTKYQEQAAALKMAMAVALKLKRAFDTAVVVQERRCSWATRSCSVTARSAPSASIATA